MMCVRTWPVVLGWLKRLNPEINGLDGTQCNLVDPSDASSDNICVTDQGALVDPDPSHSLSGTAFEIYGTKSVAAEDEHNPDKVTMGGFVATEIQNKGEAEWGPHIMDCLAPEHVPVISTLATEFALFDRFFAGIPGPTIPNRLFGMSATSQGYSTNDHRRITLGWQQEPMFRLVEDVGLDWRVYFQDAATPWLFKWGRTKERLAKSRQLHTFKSDVAAGDLPALTWIDPSYLDMPELGFPASDQHPSHDVAEGEALIKMVYEALRASPVWNETALVVTYDEHGGFFDHVPTPVAGVPSPDGIACVDCAPEAGSFNFTRLGVRIPAIVASPWVPKGTLVHGPDPASAPSPTSEYELSSLSATVKELFGAPAFLNARDAWAMPLHGVFEDSSLAAPRTDCPLALPEVWTGDAGDAALPPAARRAARAAHVAAGGDGASQAPVSELQLELLVLVEGLASEPGVVVDGSSEEEGGEEPADGGAARLAAAKARLEASGALATEGAAGRYMLARVEAALAAAAARR